MKHEFAVSKGHIKCLRKTQQHIDKLIRLKLTFLSKENVVLS